MIFTLKTGHCRLLSHLYRLNLSHTNQCPCGTVIWTPEHLLPALSILPRHQPSNLAQEGEATGEAAGTCSIVKDCRLRARDWTDSPSPAWKCRRGTWTPLLTSQASYQTGEQAYSVKDGLDQSRFMQMVTVKMSASSSQLWGLDWPAEGREATAVMNRCASRLADYLVTERS